jgi:septal ring factor EnvC (AmiA/AmiB activator)
MEGDLEPRVRRLEEGQRAWFELANHLRRGQDATNDRLDRIEGDVGTLKTDVGTLKTDVGTLKTDVGTLKTDVGTLKAEMVEVKGSLSELQSQVNRLELAVVRIDNKTTAQYELLSGYIARQEGGAP